MILSWNIGVGSTTTSECGNNIDEPTVVLDATLCPSGLLLLLFRLLHLGGLALDLTGTRQRSVHLTTEQWHNQVQLDVAQRVQGVGAGENATFARQMEVIGVQVLDGRQLSLERNYSVLAKTISQIILLLSSNLRLWWTLERRFQTLTLTSATVWLASKAKTWVWVPRMCNCMLKTYARSEEKDRISNQPT